VVSWRSSRARLNAESAETRANCCDERQTPWTRCTTYTTRCYALNTSRRACRSARSSPSSVSIPDRIDGTPRRPDHRIEHVRSPAETRVITLRAASEREQERRVISDLKHTFAVIINHSGFSIARTGNERAMLIAPPIASRTVTAESLHRSQSLTKPTDKAKNTTVRPISRRPSSDASASSDRCRPRARVGVELRLDPTGFSAVGDRLIRRASNLQIADDQSPDSRNHAQREQRACHVRCRCFLKVLSLPREAALCRLSKVLQVQGPRTNRLSPTTRLPASRLACREFRQHHEAEYGFRKCLSRHARPADCPTTRLHAHDASGSGWISIPSARHGAVYTCCSSSHDSLAAAHFGVRSR